MAEEAIETRYQLLIQMAYLTSGPHCAVSRRWGCGRCDHAVLPTKATATSPCVINHLNPVRTIMPYKRDLLRAISPQPFSCRCGSAQTWSHSDPAQLTERAKVGSLASVSCPSQEQGTQVRRWSQSRRTVYAQPRSFQVRVRRLSLKLAPLVAGGKPLLISSCMDVRGFREAGDKAPGWLPIWAGADFSGQKLSPIKILAQR